MKHTEMEQDEYSIAQCHVKLMNIYIHIIIERSEGRLIGDAVI